jgi:hypothetical protein
MTKWLWRRRRMCAMGSVSVETMVLTVDGVAIAPWPTGLATASQERPIRGAKERRPGRTAGSACPSPCRCPVSSDAGVKQPASDLRAILLDSSPPVAICFTRSHRCARHRKTPVEPSAAIRTRRESHIGFPTPLVRSQPHLDRRQHAPQGRPGRDRKSRAAAGERHPCGSSGGLTWRPPGSSGGNPPRPTSM